MKIVAIVQAHMGSTRLPNKVMKLINGVPMIEILLRRLGKSKKLDQIVLATSVDVNDQVLTGHVESLGFKCTQGSKNDVLERYVQAAKENQADVIVRITGDCPLVDPVLVDECISKFIESKVDYLSNTIPPTYPDGLDVEVMGYKTLKKADEEAKKLFHREHVTPYIHESNFFSKNNYQNDTLQQTIN